MDGLLTSAAAPAVILQLAGIRDHDENGSQSQNIRIVANAPRHPNAVLHAPDARCRSVGPPARDRQVPILVGRWSCACRRFRRSSRQKPTFSRTVRPGQAIRIAGIPWRRIASSRRICVVPQSRRDEDCVANQHLARVTGSAVAARNTWTCRRPRMAMSHGNSTGGNASKLAPARPR